MSPWRSWFYRAWVVGGLVLVVVLIIKIALDWKPGTPPPYGVIGVILGIWLIGLLALQAFHLMRARPGPAPALTAGERAELLEPGPSRDPERLAAALSLSGVGTVDAAAEAAWRFNLGMFVPAAVVAIVLPLAGLLFVSGAVPGVWSPLGATGPGIPVAAIPGLLIVLVLVVLLPRTMGRARRLGDDHLAPLGLHIDKTPGSTVLPRIGTGGLGHHVVGPTVFVGDRHGRHVTVAIESGTSVVQVAATVDDFVLQGKKGALVAKGGLPGAVASELTTIPRDPRWTRLTVIGGGEGIEVQRRGRSQDQGWLADLWLAERLAAAVAAAPGAARMPLDAPDSPP
jgi:hypothetical protein